MPGLTKKNSATQAVHWCLTAGLTLSSLSFPMLGCSREVQSLRRPPEEPLPTAERERWGAVNRGLLRYPDGTAIVVLHPENSSAGSVEDPLEVLTREELGIRGYLFSNAGEWCVSGNQNTSNCHAYALGERLGLKPGDWVNGVSELQDGLLRNPMGEALKAFFVPVASYRLTSLSDLQTLLFDQRLQDGDVIVLCGRGPLGDKAYVHSGRILKKETENWVVSKAGELGLIHSPFAVLLRPDCYLSGVDEIEVYRFKGIDSDNSSH